MADNHPQTQSGLMMSDQAPTIAPQAPTIMIDGFHGFSVAGGVVKLNCTSTVFDVRNNSPARELVLRLAIPLEILPQLTGLADAVRNLPSPPQNAE